MATFRKTSKKRGAIRSITTAEEEGEDLEEDSTLTAIQLTKKKQKLAQSTLYKRGLDATCTIGPGTMHNSGRITIPEPEEKTMAVANDAQNKLFKTMFSSTENGPTETIMQQKHISAMEEFINRKLTKDKENDEENDVQDHVEDDAQHVREADMGAGGTMLGGTGIAEVILPVETRIETAKQTEELRARLPGAFGRKAVSSAGYHLDLEQSDVSGLGSSFSQTFREFKPQRPSSSVTNDLSANYVSVSSSAPDDDRVGFQALRHGQTKEPRQQHQRGNDDRLLKQFMKKERAKR
jgi:hypothetical protein